jgi:uncharacterized protein
MTVVHRPIVRSFTKAHQARCADHVRGGGHGVFWETATRAVLVLPVPNEDDPSDLALFSILDLAKQRWNTPKAGHFKGLATCLVPRDCHAIVRARVWRDSVFPGPTRKVSFDCLKCGACCKDNEVILQPDDLARFAEAGRADLAKPPYARKRADGKIVLLLLKPSTRCQHLRRDLKCSIYTVRPDSCSSFPVGSEGCLFARHTELGLIDGSAPLGEEVKVLN